MLESLGESRKEALEQIVQLKKKLNLDTDDLALRTKVDRERLINDLQQERSQLASLIIKQKNFALLKQSHLSADFNRRLGKITDNANRAKRKEINTRLVNEKRLAMCEEQKEVLKAQLAQLDVECNNVRRLLNKEVCWS